MVAQKGLPLPLYNFKLPLQTSILYATSTSVFHPGGHTMHI